LLAIFTVPNARNAMDLIKLNITGKWCSVVRQTNLPRLETKKGELCTYSFSIVRGNIRWIVLVVHSGSIDLTEIGT